MRLYARHRPSVRLSVCPSVRPSVRLSVRPSVCPQDNVHSFITILVKLCVHVRMVKRSDEFEDGHTRATGGWLRRKKRKKTLFGFSVLLTVRIYSNSVRWYSVGYCSYQLTLFTACGATGAINARLRKTHHFLVFSIQINYNFVYSTHTVPQLVHLTIYT